MSMLHESLKKYKFPYDKLHEQNPRVVLALMETIKTVYNQLKKLPENKKVSRQKLMDNAVIKVYNHFKNEVNTDEVVR